MNSSKLDALVVLETMYDWESRTSSAGYTEEAPRYFTINPDNKSGRRLYQILGERQFLVTNACRELVTGPNQHGKPDPIWLASNLQLIKKWDYSLLIVCGKVAWNCYKTCSYRPPQTRVVRMKHPAARDWTKEEIERWRRYLGNGS